MIIDERMSAFIDSLDRGNTPFLDKIEKNALEKAPTHINPACPRLNSPEIPTTRFRETARMT